jgi:hypothetical protein
MKIRLNQPDKDRDGSIDHPSMDPSRKHHFPNEDERAEEASADFPADVGNDMGQYSEEQGNSYPPFPSTTEEAGGIEVLNAAQQGGSGPRIDDLGIDDLQDVPRDQDLAAIDEYTQDMGDRPVFDRSIENTDIGETDIETGMENTRPGKNARLPQKEDQLADEESEVYDVSIDGPGTRDLH